MLGLDPAKLGPLQQLPASTRTSYEEASSETSHATSSTSISSGGSLSSPARASSSSIATTSASATSASSLAAAALLSSDIHVHEITVQTRQASEPRHLSSVGMGHDLFYVDAIVREEVTTNESTDKVVSSNTIDSADGTSPAIVERTQSLDDGSSQESQGSQGLDAYEDYDCYDYDSDDSNGNSSHRPSNSSTTSASTSMSGTVVIPPPPVVVTTGNAQVSGVIVYPPPPFAIQGNNTNTNVAVSSLSTELGDADPSLVLLHTQPQYTNNSNSSTGSKGVTPRSTDSIETVNYNNTMNYQQQLLNNSNNNGVYPLSSLSTSSIFTTAPSIDNTGSNNSNAGVMLNTNSRRSIDFDDQQPSSTSTSHARRSHSHELDEEDDADERDDNDIIVTSTSPNKHTNKHRSGSSANASIRNKSTHSRDTNESENQPTTSSSSPSKRHSGGKSSHHTNTSSNSSTSSGNKHHLVLHDDDDDDSATNTQDTTLQQPTKTAKRISPPKHSMSNHVSSSSTTATTSKVVTPEYQAEEYHPTTSVPSLSPHKKSTVTPVVSIPMDLSTDQDDDGTIVSYDGPGGSSASVTSHIMISLSDGEDTDDGRGGTGNGIGHGEGQGNSDNSDDDFDFNDDKSAYTMKSNMTIGTISTHKARAKLVQEIIPTFFDPKQHNCAFNSKLLSEESLASKLPEIRSWYSQHVRGIPMNRFAGITKRLCGLPSYCNLLLCKRMSELLYPNVGVTVPSTYGFNRTERKKLKIAVSIKTFLEFWSLEMEPYDKVERLFNLIKQPNVPYIIPDDFKPVLSELLYFHPGLKFMEPRTDIQEKYVMSVISRIFYKVNTSKTGKITLREFRQGDLYGGLLFVDEVRDIDKELNFFSYEHFYVLACTFMTLDVKEKSFLSKNELQAYNDRSLSPIVLDR